MLGSDILIITFTPSSNRALPVSGGAYCKKKKIKKNKNVEG